jgi:hypothetical protein
MGGGDQGRWGVPNNFDGDADDFFPNIMKFCLTFFA